MGAFRKELLLQIGPIQTTVNLHSVAPSSKPSVRRVCPDHSIPLKQQYRCLEGDGHDIAWGEWDSAVETAKGWRKVDPDQRPTLEAATKVMELVPVPAKEIADNTFATDTLYWVSPASDASLMNWTMLVRQITSGKTAFVTRGGFRKGGIERLWRLEMFRDYPVLRQLQFPETITAPPETETVTIDRATHKLVAEFIETRTSSWNDIDTTDRFEKALNEWAASGELVDIGDSSTSSDEGQSVTDMMALLKEAVETKP